jgi:hypothetical protein
MVRQKNTASGKNRPPRQGLENRAMTSNYAISRRRTTANSRTRLPHVLTPNNAWQKSCLLLIA